MLVFLVVEDELSEHLLRTLLRQTGRDFVVGAVYGKQGSDYIKRNIRAFNRSAAGLPYIILSDLDRVGCPPELIQQWFDCGMMDYSERCHQNLVFRIAVRESEAWIMADRERFAEFLGIRVNAVPYAIDDVEDPKRLLLNLARHCRRRDLRDDIVPRPRDQRIVGPDYTGRLSGFVTLLWRAEIAQERSPSLRRSFEALKKFRPTSGA
jgi:hypothetical protein